MEHCEDRTAHEDVGENGRQENRKRIRQNAQSNFKSTPFLGGAFLFIKKDRHIGGPRDRRHYMSLKR